MLEQERMREVVEIRARQGVQRINSPFNIWLDSIQPWPLCCKPGASCVMREAQECRVMQVVCGAGEEQWWEEEGGTARDPDLYHARRRPWTRTDEHE